MDSEKTQSLIEVVQIIEEFEAVQEASKRVPDHLKHTYPYSANALWTFYLDTEHQPEGPSCVYCKMFDGKAFTGSQLRSVFPHHKWVGDDIYANVHRTLWGEKNDDTCGCLLVRDDEKWGQEPNLDLWSQLGTDWKDSKPKEE